MPRSSPPTSWWSRALAAVGLTRTPAAPTVAVRDAWSAAQVTRLTEDWLATWRSPDQDNRWELRRLRIRAREMRRNNALVSSYAAALVQNVVGSYGFQLQARTKTARGADNTAVNDAIEAAWRRWATDPGACSASGQHTLQDLLDLVVQTEGVEGEVLIQKVRNDPNSPFRFSLQLIDGDRLDETYNVIDTGDGGEIRQSVEINRYGRVVAYWLWTVHPNDPNGAKRERQRVPASDVLHYFRPIRTGQHRGASPLAPVMMRLKMLDGYQEAELVAARTAAAKMGFIVTDPEKMGDFPVDDTGGNLQMAAEPGTIGNLLPGQDFRPWDPSHPTQAYEAFTRAAMREVAAGIGVSYATLTGDLSQANYSSARVGLLAEREAWKREQQRLVAHVLVPIYREWLRYAVLSGELQLPSYDLTRYHAVEFKGRGYPWVDPVKDMEGAAMEVAMGLTSLSALAAERGREFSEVVAERAREQAIAEAAGVDVALPLKMASAPALPAGALDEAPDDQGADDAPASAAKLSVA